MTRADLLLSLTRSALAGDREQARATVRAITAEEAQKKHTVLARQLRDALDATEMHRPAIERLGQGTQQVEADSLREVMPKRTLSDLFLHDRVRTQMHQFIEEQHRSQLLRTYGVEPRHTLLLVGPSGNGKTSLAEAMASELALPYFVLRYEQVLTSFLGETAARLTAALQEVATRHCVLFLDEFDIVGKERSDEHDAGEIKRVVSSLLLQLDSLPSHVVLVAATNHPQLLDSAIWRRFELQLAINAPDSEERAQFAHECVSRIRLTISESQLSRLLAGIGEVSYADIESVLLTLRRREILTDSAWSPAVARKEVSSMLSAWEERPKP